SRKGVRALLADTSRRLDQSRHHRFGRRRPRRAHPRRPLPAGVTGTGSTPRRAGFDCGFSATDPDAEPRSSKTWIDLEIRRALPRGWIYGSCPRFRRCYHSAVPIWMLVVPAIPGLAWLWAFYRTDRYQPEPPRLVALTFLLGALSTLPAVGAEVLAARAYPFLGPVEKPMPSTGTALPLPPLAFGSFVVIGPLPELAQFLVLRLRAYRHP